METVFKVDESIINRINRGEDKAFKILYDNYFTYLCTCAISYIFDPDKAKEIVNDIFINIWVKRGNLEFPIHSYLLRSVQYGCLNHIRTLKSQQTLLDKYREELYKFQEENCFSDVSPLNTLELKELEEQVKLAVDQLPGKCRSIFSKYIYEGKSPKEIASELDISVNTVRVQIKIALDKIRPMLGLFAGVLLYITNK